MIQKLEKIVSCKLVIDQGVYDWMVVSEVNDLWLSQKSMIDDD
jgi:hypothetical protein